MSLITKSRDCGKRTLKRQANLILPKFTSNQSEIGYSNNYRTCQLKERGSLYSNFYAI